jgi:tetratricopeptide (TPR) repeat protein
VFRKNPRFACALAALERREFLGAEAALSGLLEEPCTRVERAYLLNKRGVARIALDLRELAWDDFNAALQAIDEYPPALTNLGNLSLEDGAVDEAILLYERAIANDQEYAVAYLNLGVAFKQQGRIDEAVRVLRRADRIERRANVPTFWRPARRR